MGERAVGAGTTGDAWELTPAETRDLIGIVLDNVQRLQLHLLLGALHPDAAQARRIVEENLGMLRERAGIGSTGGVWKQSHVSGFTICPPRGEGIGQEQMRRELSSILKLGVPIALYQLPQVTQNQMGPDWSPIWPGVSRTLSYSKTPAALIASRCRG